MVAAGLINQLPILCILLVEPVQHILVVELIVMVLLEEHRLRGHRHHRLQNPSFLLLLNELLLSLHQRPYLSSLFLLNLTSFLLLLVVTVLLALELGELLELVVVQVLVEMLLFVMGL